MRIEKIFSTSSILQRLTATLLCLCGVTVLSISQLSISSFTPTSGPVGTSVTINGSGFGTPAGNSFVYFGGVRAAVTSTSASTLIVTVPAGAAYGPISVFNLLTSLTGYSSSHFIVTFNAIRDIDSAFFATKVDYSTLTGTSPRGVALADFDADGRLDVAVANTGNGRLTVHRNISSAGSLTTGSFAAPVVVTIDTGLYAIAIGDLDGDGRLDLAVSDSSGSNVYVLRNTSAGPAISFGLPVTLTTGTKPRGIAIGDIDGDGKPDIAVANSDSVSVLRNTSPFGSISFAARVRFGAGTNPYDITMQDFSLDLLPELVVTNYGSNNISVRVNTSSPGSINFDPAIVTVGVGTNPRGVAVADLDGDGKQDIVVANQSSNTVSLLRNTSISATPTFATKVDFAVGPLPYDVAIGDVEGDGKPDIVVSNFSGDSVSVLRNTTSGAGAFTSSSLAARVHFAAGDGPYGISVGDLDRDGKPDIVVANTNINTFSALRNRAVKAETEPNNVASQAVTLIVGETVQGTISLSTDVDYYSFYVPAGDTVEIFGSPAGTSELYSGFDVMDSTGNYVVYYWQMYNYSIESPHAVFVGLTPSRTYYIRYRYLFDAYGTFPNVRPDGVSQVPITPPASSSSAASQDTGAYRIRVERFAPSAPEVQRYPYMGTVFYNSSRLEGSMKPNGLSTTVEVEYGTTPTLGSVVVADQSPVPAGINEVGITAQLTGLIPNVSYYYRVKVTNSQGTSYSLLNSFQTPPLPQGWVRQPSGTAFRFYGVSFTSTSTGFAVGDGGIVAKTTDGGNSWTNTSLTGYGLQSVSFFSSRGITVGGGGTIFRTSNSGTNWTDESLFGTINYAPLYGVWTLNLTTAVAVGYYGYILRTIDSGDNWSIVHPYSGNYYFNDVHFAFGTSTGFAVGSNGVIFRSTNSGATWDSLSSGTTDYLYDVYFFDATTGIVVGSNGTIRRTTDGGVSWAAISTGLPGYWLYDVSFSDLSNGVIVGESGIILRTTDGGLNWTQQQSGTYVALLGSAFVGRSATIVGDNGVIYNYLDPVAEAESNDNTASAMLMAYRDEVNARIDPADIDYYKFVAAGADTVEIFVQGRDTAVVNGLLRLYNIDGTTALDSSDNFVPGDTVRSRIVRVLPGPGTYYVRYIGNTPAATGNYRISLNKTSLTPLVPFGGVATILTTSEAILKSPVIPNNLATTIQFEYGLTAAYGSTVTADQSGVSGQQLVTATKTVSFLVPFTEHHFRVKATSSAGTAYGPDVTFTTALGMLRSEIESNNISSNANTIFVGDTVQGTISTNTDVDYFRFQAAAGDTLEIFVTQRNASNLDSRVEVTDSTGGTNQFLNNNYMPDSKSLHLAFVAINTGVYHIRQTYAYNYSTYYPNQAPRTPEIKIREVPNAAVATDNGAYELRLKRFTPAAPDVRTTPWADVTFSTSAQIHADVSSNGFPTAVYVEYGTTQALGSSVQYAGGPVNTIYYWNWFRVPLTGLVPNSLYYFRVKAVNAIGTSYSNIMTFTTAPLSERWTLRPSGTDRGLTDISAASDSLAIVLAQGTMLRTTNAGTTWSEVSLPRYPYSVSFKNADTAFAMGYEIIRSTDRGATWQFYQNLPLNTYVQRISFFNQQIGGAVGGYYSPEVGQWIGHISRTVDGGATWQRIRSTSRDMRDLSFASPDTIQAVDYQGLVYRTTNFTSTSPTWDSTQITGASVNAMKFVDADTGIVVGNVIRRTTNRGISWTAVANPGYYMYDVAMKNALVGIAVGGGGRIFRTTNAGATWTQEESGATTWLQTASYSGRTAFAMGDAGTILRSIDPFDEGEPNNTSSQAQTLAYDDQVTGTIQPSSDVDYYKFTASLNDTVEVLLRNTTFNGKVELLGTNGSTVLATNDDYVAGDTSRSRIVFVLSPAGVYYVRVTPATASGAGSYLLRVKKTSLRPVIASRGYSNLAPTSVTLSATLDPNNLSTSVSFKWGTTGNFNNTAPGVPSPISGQQRQTVTAALSSLASFTDYNFRVVATNAAGSDTSLPQNFFTPRASAIAEVEANDTTLFAQEIAFGDSVNGRISTLTDVDYYKIRVSASDTLEVFASRRGASELFSRIEIYDSTTNQFRWSNNYLPSAISPHQIDVTGSATTLYIRYKYAYDYTTNFPGIIGDEELPQPIRNPSLSAQAATNDTGEYRLYVRRFVPSAPDAQDFVGYGSIFWDSVIVSTTIAPNGLPTSVNFEYGPTPGYGNQVPATAGPFTGISRNGVSGQIGGLQGGTTYYVRSVATNGAGTSYGGGNTTTTPPAPEGWSRRKFGTLNITMRDVDFVSESVGYIAGSGSILKTIDGGTIWVAQTSPVGANYQGVSFVNSSTGTMVGTGGRIIRTTDGGANWALQTSGTTQTLRNVRMLGPDTVVAVGFGGWILRTTNGGTNWSTVRSGSYALHGVAFSPSRDTGYAVGDLGTILRTTDKGASWDSLTSGTTVPLLSARFADGRNGIVVGGNFLLLKTTDAGATWTQTNLSSPGGYYLYDIAFTDASNGVVVGDYGRIFRTYDGGATWSTQQSGTYNTFTAVAFAGRRATATGAISTIMTAVGLLANPTNLQASYASPNLVNVNWNENANGETGYFVERKIGSGGTFALRRTTAANTSAITDTVEQGRIYNYRARAFNAIDTSAYSAEDSALVPLAVAMNFTANSISSTQINLSWSNVADARTGYKIERKTGAGGTYAEIATVGDVTAYQNTGLSPGTKYFYLIRSYNADMNSAYSAEDTAATALSRPAGIAINPSGWSGSDWFEISWTSPTIAAKAWYRVDSAPTAAQPGTQADLLTATSFGFTLPAAGQHWVYFYLADSSGNKDYATYDSLQARWDNVSPQISHNNSLVSVVTYLNGNITSSPVSINATVTKTGGFTALQSAVLEFKKTNSNTVNTSNYPSASGGSVPILNVTFLTNAKPNGVDYRISAIDQAGNYVETPWYSIPVQVQNNTISDFVQPAAGESTDENTLVKGYRLFSVPFDLSDKKPGSFMETTDKGFGPHAKEGVNYVNWKMQRFLSGGATRQDYEEFKNQDVLTPAAAFFLISREQRTITVGAGSLVKAQDMFNTGISVQNGWNLVGNPFPDDFPADSLFVVSGSIATRAYYDGIGPDAGWYKTGTQVQSLKKWEGLAINVSVTGSTFLRFKAVPPASNQKDVPPPPVVVSAQAALEQEQGDGWLLKFHAYRRDNDTRDIDNALGTAPNAREGYDPYDSFQPPLLIGKNVALYFKNPDGAMSDDIRPVKGDGQTWEMRVLTGDRGAKIRLNVEQAVSIPDPTTQAYMLDTEDHMAHNLRQKTEIEFSSKEGLRNFRVVVGSKQFVDSVSASLGIDLVPRSMTLYQNYPNPFNPETSVRFTVPGLLPSYKVTLRIYNIIGQEVATLIDREMPGGYYETVFNARNYASGTYIYRLIVSGGTGATTYSDVKKMVLIK